MAACVDDLTMTSNTMDGLTAIKQHLNSQFKMKDLGDLHWLLDIEITRDRQQRTISFAQGAYIDTIIACFNLQDAAAISIPMDPHATLSKSQCPVNPQQIEDMKNIPYREAVGSLMWAAVATRPDIAFAVSFLSQFMVNPGRPHWEAVKCVLKYLKGMKDRKLTFGEERSGIEGYTDTDWGLQEHRHSISGYAFLIDGGAISWSSKKQSIIALSSTEAEYIAAAHIAKEALWIRSLLSEIARPLSLPITIYSDNQSAIALTKEAQHHARTKHIDLRFHFICEAVDSAALAVQYCPTEHMVADLLTKALPRAKVNYFASRLGICST